MPSPITQHPEALEKRSQPEQRNIAELSPVQRDSAEHLKSSLQIHEVPDTPHHIERQEALKSTRVELLELTQRIFYPILGV